MSIDVIRESNDIIINTCTVSGTSIDKLFHPDEGEESLHVTTIVNLMSLCEQGFIQEVEYPNGQKLYKITRAGLILRHHGGYEAYKKRLDDQTTLASYQLSDAIYPLDAFDLELKINRVHQELSKVLEDRKRLLISILLPVGMLALLLLIYFLWHKFF